MKLPDKEFTPLKFMPTSGATFIGWFADGYFYRGDITVDKNGQSYVGRYIGKYTKNVIVKWKYIKPLK